MNFPELRFKDDAGQNYPEWNNSTLGAVATISSGGTPSRLKSEYWNGNIPWVTTTLIDFNIIHSANEYITETGLKNSSAKMFPKDTLLMAMYGQGKTRGKVAVLGFNASTNQACAAILLSEKVITGFVLQNLAGRYDEIRELSNAGGQENLSAGLIKEISFTYPSIHEQTKIANFLTTIDEKIAQLTQKHELLAQYKKSVMRQIFSKELRFKSDKGRDFPEWVNYKITDLAKTFIGLVTTMTTSYVEKGIPLIRNSDIKQNKILKNGLINLDVNFASQHQNRMLKINDVVTVHTGDVGVSAVIDESLDGCLGFATLNTRITSKLLSSHFLCWFYNSHAYLNFALSMSTGDGRCNFNLKDFDTSIIPVPHINEQTKIADFLNAIDNKLTLTQNQLGVAKQYKLGLLQQMFV